MNRTTVLTATAALAGVAIVVLGSAGSTVNAAKPPATLQVTTIIDDSDALGRPYLISSDGAPYVTTSDGLVSSTVSGGEWMLNTYVLATSRGKQIIKRSNREGVTNQDFPHEVKVLGSVRLQLWGPVTISGVYRYQSGAPWQRAANFGGQTGLNAIFMEPRGSRRTDALNEIDVRGEKSMRVEGSTNLGLFVDVFNVTNQGEALRVFPQSGPNLGLPLQWTAPRTARAGVHLTF